MEHDFVMSPIVVKVMIGVAGLFVLAGCAGSATRSSAQSGDRGNSPGGVAAAVSDAAQSNCSISAVLASVPSQAIAPGAFAPAESAPIGVLPLSEGDAVTLAHAALARQTGKPAPADAPTVAVQESYSDYVKATGLTADARIDPYRCVWVVTTTTPLSIPHPPDESGVTSTGPLSQYSVVLDVASRTLVEFVAR
jgi:hypothetical protein